MDIVGDKLVRQDAEDNTPQKLTRGRTQEEIERDKREEEELKKKGKGNG